MQQALARFLLQLHLAHHWCHLMIYCKRLTTYALSIAHSFQEQQLCSQMLQHPEHQELLALQLAVLRNLHKKQAGSAPL